MALKIFAASCLLAVVSAQYAPAPKPYAPAPAYAPKPYAPKPYAPEPEPYDHPKYDFEYAVNDATTYDIKSQKEERDGDYVKGVYELYEPDGTKRIVTYSDDGYGFQAVVTKEGEKAYAPKPYAPAPAPYAPKPYAPAPAPYAPKPYAPAPAPYAPKPYAPAPYPAPAPKPYAPAPAPSYSPYYKKPAY